MHRNSNNSEAPPAPPTERPPGGGPRPDRALRAGCPRRHHTCGGGGADSGCQSPAELELGGGQHCRHLSSAWEPRASAAHGFPTDPRCADDPAGGTPPQPHPGAAGGGGAKMLPPPVISSTGLRCPGVWHLLCPPLGPCARGWPDSAGRSAPQESACLTSSQVMLEPLAQGGSGTRAEAENPQTCPAALPLATALVTNGPDPLSHGNWTRS